jgi:hypothetical protein
MQAPTSENSTERHLSAADNEPVTIDGATLQLVPTPRVTIHLKTIDDLRLEMGKVYREMRKGTLDSQTGSRLVYVLGEIRKLIELADLEQRIELLETAKHEPEVAR